MDTNAFIATELCEIIICSYRKYLFKYTHELHMRELGIKMTSNKDKRRWADYGLLDKVKDFFCKLCRFENKILKYMIIININLNFIYQNLVIFIINYNIFSPSNIKVTEPLPEKIESQKEISYWTLSLARPRFYLPNCQPVRYYCESLSF